MVLRRVTQHLKSQNWTAVGLDLVVVVVGVLLAFQVNEWKELRQQRSREIAALQRLDQEAADIVSYVTKVVSDHDALIADEDKAVASLSDGSWSRVDPQLLSRGLYTLGLYPAISPPRSVYDELSGSGGLAEISDAQVRTAVAEYYSELTFVQAQLPYFRDDVGGYNLMLGFTKGALGVYDPSSDLRLRLDYDFASLAKNADYISAVVNLLRDHIQFQNYRKRLLRSAEAMRATLDHATSEF